MAKNNTPTVRNGRVFNLDDLLRSARYHLEDAQEREFGVQEMVVTMERFFDREESVLHSLVTDWRAAFTKIENDRRRGTITAAEGSSRLNELDVAFNDALADLRKSWESAATTRDKKVDNVIENALKSIDSSLKGYHSGYEDDSVAQTRFENEQNERKDKLVRTIEGAKRAINEEKTILEKRKIEIDRKASRNEIDSDTYITESDEIQRRLNSLANRQNRINELEAKKKEITDGIDAVVKAFKEAAQKVRKKAIHELTVELPYREDIKSKKSMTDAQKIEKPDYMIRTSYRQNMLNGGYTYQNQDYIDIFSEQLVLEKQQRDNTYEEAVKKLDDAYHYGPLQGLTTEYNDALNKLKTSKTNDEAAAELRVYNDAYLGTGYSIDNYTRGKERENHAIQESLGRVSDKDAERWERKLIDWFTKDATNAYNDIARNVEEKMGMLEALAQDADFNNKPDKADEYRAAISDLNDKLSEARQQTDALTAAYAEQIKTQRKNKENSKRTGGKSDKWANSGNRWAQKNAGTLGKIEQVAEIVTTVAKTASTVAIKNIEIDAANLTAEVQTAISSIAEATDIAVRSISQGGDVMAKSLTVFTNGLTQGAVEGAFAAANANTELVNESFTNTMKDVMTRLREQNKRNIIEQERYNKVYALEAERTQAIIEGATSTLNSVFTLAGAPVAGMITSAVGGAIKSLHDSYTSWRKAENEFELTKMKLDAEYNEKVQEQFQEFAQAGMETATKIVGAGQDFYHTVSNAYTKIEDSAMKTARMMGYNADGAKGYVSEIVEMQKSMTVTLDSGEVVHMDKNADEMLKLQEGYAEQTGFNIKMMGDDYLKTFSLGKLWGDETAQALTSSMYLFNRSAADSSDIFYEMYDAARRMGISQAKYSKDLIKNLKMAEKYQFKGGTKGLMEMSAWAQKVRFNMDSLGGMLENIQEGGLENIITKSASLQVLGGNFAQGSDPLAMMYEGFQDPEALAKRYNDMIANMGYFDKDTGEAKFGTGEQMMLRQFAKATGQDVSDVMNQQRQRIKGEEIDKYLVTRYTEEQKNLIYSKATRTEDGTWTFNGKDINNLSEADFIELAPIEEKIERNTAGMLSIMERDKGVTIYGNNNLISNNEETLRNSANAMIEENERFYTKNNEAFKTLIDTAAAYTEVSQEEMHKRLLGTVDNLSVAYYVIAQQMADETNHLTDSTNDAARAMQALTYGVEGAAAYFEQLTGASPISQDGVSFAAKQLINDLETRGLRYRDENGVMQYDRAGIASALNNWDLWQDDEMEKYVEMLRKNANMRQNLTGEHAELLRAIAEWKDEGLLGIRKDTQNFVITNEAEAQFLKDNGVKIRGGADNKTNIGGLNVSEGSVSDGVAFANNTPMTVSASSVTPIGDGHTIAKSDPNDHALFAKVGGPFDTLFNGVFEQVNNIYDYVRNADTIEIAEPQKIESYVAPIANNMSASSVTPIGDGHMSFDTIRIDGRLELTSPNGGSIDIIDELQKNPALLREVTRMISDNISAQFNGGRSVYNGGRMVSFNKGC